MSPDEAEEESRRLDGPAAPPSALRGVAPVTRPSTIGLLLPVAGPSTTALLVPGDPAAAEDWPDDPPPALGGVPPVVAAVAALVPAVLPVAGGALALAAHAVGLVFVDTVAGPPVGPLGSVQLDGTELRLMPLVAAKNNKTKKRSNHFVRYQEKMFLIGW